MHIRTFFITDIDYDICEEDLDGFEPAEVEMELIKKSLPTEMTVEVTEDDLELANDLDEVLANKISERTGYLVKNYFYEEAYDEKK